MRKEIVDFLLEKQKPRRFEPGEILFNQGDNPSEFYYLLNGLSLTYIIFEDGRERNMLISWPGQIFGASTFFERVPRRASAIAIKRCDVLTVTSGLYEQCRVRFPDFQDVILQELSKDIGTLFDELADVSMINAEKRVARFLCRRLVNGQYSGTKENPELQYTQEFIAGVLGISRMSVSQAIAGLIAKGWLETNYGRIRILDTGSLQAYAYR